MAALSSLFEPVTIGNVEVPNRLMITVHGVILPLQRYIRYLTERADRGVGLVGITAGLDIHFYPTFPTPYYPAYDGHLDAVWPNPATFEGILWYDERVIPQLQPVAEAVHQVGAKCVGQVFHLGGNRHGDNLMPAVAPSPIRDDADHEIPHELEQEEIDDLVLAFGHSARRIREAGLDMVEIHAAHGYLIAQFLSPLTNRRTDRYGGSLENRMRFLMEVIAAIRQQVGDEYPVGIRMNVDEMADGGLTVADSQEIARRLDPHLAYFNISGGSYTGLKDGVKMSYVTSWYEKPGPNVPMAAAIKGVVDKPVIVAAQIIDPAHAARIIADGSADMVGVARAMIADPHWARKAREGRLEDIRKCAGNNECHAIGHRQPSVTCAINPGAGREDEFDLAPAKAKKRVLVVGGGAAGMEAALVAAQRGHQVTLCERDDTLGGQLSAIARISFRGRFADYIDYQEKQLRKAGVEVRLSTEVSLDVVHGMQPDAVVNATGSVPQVPSLPGSRAGVVDAIQVFRGQVEVGERVLVVGGLEDHLPAPSTAEFLASQGKRVTLITELRDIGENIEHATLFMLVKRLLELGVETMPLTRFVAAGAEGVRVLNVFTRQETLLERLETIVFVSGNQAQDDLYRGLKGTVPELYNVGDSRAPRRLIHAVREGSRAGRLIGLLAPGTKL